MKRWFGVLNIIVTVYLMFFIVMFVRLQKNVTTDYDTERLNMSMESAAEAAFIVATASGDLGIDYTDLTSLTLSPAYCLDIFEELICLNYDMSICPENLAYVESCIPAAVLACNDGFYITEPRSKGADDDALAATGEIGLGWSIKRPYLVEYDSAGSLTSFAVEINTEKWSKAQFAGGSFDITYGTLYSEAGAQGYLTKDLVTRRINSVITDAFASAVRQTAELRGSKPYNIYIPPVTTSHGINNVAGPSFLIVMQDADFTGDAKVEEAVLSGLRTAKKTYIIGFMDDDGVKRYCYEGQLPDSMMERADAFFYSLEDAAKAGYRPAYEYLSRKVEK